MTWALRQMPGVEELFAYESKLNDFLPCYPQVILCMYDLDRFSGEVLVDILKTHPTVLIGGMVLDNPYYLECGGNYHATASALMVHRSTLKYRLQRIREISGHQLSGPDTRFNLQLSTRTWRTLVALRTQKPAT